MAAMMAVFMAVARRPANAGVLSESGIYFTALRSRRYRQEELVLLLAGWASD